MTGADHESTSAVSDEAVRLVSALAAMAGPAHDNGRGQDASDPTRTEASDADAPEPGAADPPDTGAAPACACANPSVQSVCDICPVCRVAAFLSEVRPETVERVADLLSMVAGSLEAFAAQRRTDMGGADDQDPTAGAGTTRGDARWEPVPVEDEDEDA